MSQLTPCPECQRHVRKSETCCPFCGTAVSLAHIPAPALPRKRLGRAATFAFGASVVGATALVACGDDDSGAPVPVYGAPSAGSSSFAGNTNNDAGAGTTIYGGAPAAGSGNDEPGGNGGTSGNGGAAGEGGVPTDGGFGGGLIYGAPPSGAGGI
jgi:hypothetical protein